MAEQKKPRRSSTGGPGPRNVDQTNWRQRLQEGRIKFDDDRKEVFLQAFAKTNRMHQSAEAAGVSLQTVRNHIENDPDFAEAFHEAQVAYRDKVHETLYHIAVEGVDEPILGGKDRDFVVTHVRKYYERSLLAEARRVDPDYKERSEVDMNHKGGVIVIPGDLTPDQFEEEMERHRQAQQREDA